MATALLVGLLAPAAHGASVRECGDFTSAYAGNITTRIVTCSEARRVVRAWNKTAAKRGGNGRVLSYYCKYRDIKWEAGDIRCTATGGRVVHWQTGV